MHRSRMVRLITVGNAFHARVIAARLGAEGIVTELQGNVDGPYPVGNVHVLVGENDLSEARDLLLADEIESAFDPGPGDAAAPASRARWVVLAAVVLVAVVAAFARLL